MRKAAGIGTFPLVAMNKRRPTTTKPGNHAESRMTDRPTSQAPRAARAEIPQDHGVLQMGLFSLKCPGCGVWLEANEDDVGTMAECSECGRKFPLAKGPEKTGSSGEGWGTFSFAEPVDKLEYTRPLFLALPSGILPVRYWSDVHRLCLSYVFKNNPDKLKELIDIRAPFRRTLLFSRHPERLRHALGLGDGIYAEFNLSAHEIVKIDSGLVAYCGFPPTDFSVTYQIQKKHPPEGKGGLAQTTETDAAPFIEALLKDFPEGFEFNDSSVRLLENAVGQTCPESVQRELRRRMFRRHDGIYLLPEMVADGETLEAVKRQIEAYFDQFHAFSLPVLYGEFTDALHALTNPDRDFRIFLLEAILPKLPGGGKVFGRLQKQIAIPGSIEEREALDCLAGRIREILRQVGDAAANGDLLAELPCLNAEALETIIRKRLPEVVGIDVDGLRYWKLLACFCLPEDFGDEVLQIVAVIERQNKTPSLQMVANRLTERFGDNFRETYALEDDDVLRQVILKAMRKEQYEWRGNLLTSRGGSNHGRNVADEFLQGQYGIFHEKEFFDYAATHRGLTNATTLVCHNLRISCIRLDQSHWIGLADFERQSDFSDEMGQRLTREIRLRLANRRFLPLGTLPNAFFSELSPLHIQGHVFYWNAYLLASIAEQKLRSLQVVNTEPSPYTVTAMVLSQPNDFEGSDVVGFVFRALRQDATQFASADQVFDYLRENKIRMSKSKKLLARINAFWGF